MAENFIDNYETFARIVVIGVGGAGNNAVNRMIDENISSVEYYVMNTDMQALSRSKAPNRIQLGPECTKGLGAGGNPEIGKKAAEESIEEIRKIVKGANLVFVAAGMGGGTGTGAAPIIARIAKEEGALTVAIVTRPFTFEGKKRSGYAVDGLNELKSAVDSIIIVSNDKLLMVDGTIPASEAFAKSDNVLSQSVKTITDLILVPSFINLDFADIKNTLADSGIALIGYGVGSGPQRAQEAANIAISSPLLEANISGARRAICSITTGNVCSLYEAQECVNRIIEATGNSVDIKFGLSFNEELADQLLVSVIATDFSEEFDYTTIPTYDTPVQQPEEQVQVEEQPEVAQPEQEEKKEEKHSFLPNFLKNRRK